MTQEEMDLLWEECSIRSMERWEYRGGDDGKDPRAWYAMVDYEGKVYGVFLTDFYEPLSIHEISSEVPRNEDDLSDWDILPFDILDSEPLDWENDEK